MAQQVENSPIATIKVKQLVESGDRALAKGALDKAADAYSRLIQKEPNQALYHCKLGRVLLRQGEINAAERCFNQALSLNAVSHLGLYGMAQVAAARQNWEIAVEKYQQLIQMKPSHVAAVYQDLGIALSYLERWDDAIEIYQQLIQIDSNNYRYHQALGGSLSAASRHSAAIDSYQKAAQLNPKHFDAYYRLGEACFKADRPEAAAKAFNQALKLNEKLFNADKIAALSCEAAGFNEQAAVHWQRFIQKNPQSVLVTLIEKAKPQSLAELAKLAPDQLSQRLIQSQDELAQENELLLLQLHQVQEELEFYFLKNKKLESQITD